ncbi:MAG: pitrilysin family protein [bacterium]
MSYTKKKLKNGMRIITIPMKENPTTTVLVLVETGSKYENKKNNGISHFLEHICFKGTIKRPTVFELTKELDSIGAQYNAFTGHEYTGYYAKSDYKNLDIILDIISDIYLNSIFPEKETEKEKGVILEEINMYNDLPQSIVADEFYKLLYGNHPAGWKILGTKENIKKFKRIDFLNYKNKHYVASATTIIISGKINEKEIFKKVLKIFKKINKSKKADKEKVLEKQKIPQIVIHYKDTDQTHITLGVRSFDTYNKYNSIIIVLNAVFSGGMSSRLYQKLREEMGLCYYIGADNEKFTDHGVFSVSAGINSEKIKEAIIAILEEMNKLKNDLVKSEELNKAKQYLIGNLNLSLESSDSLANYYGAQEVLKKETKKPEDIIKEIKAVTAEEIKFIANKIFKNEGLNLAMVGKLKNDKEFKNILSF